MKYKKETNNFETSILGIDLFITWIIKKLKSRKEGKNNETK